MCGLGWPSMFVVALLAPSTVGFQTAGGFVRPRSAVSSRLQSTVASSSGDGEGLVPAVAAATSEAPGATAQAAAKREALIDEKLASLGVSWYQALMAMFVMMVYWADGAEVTVMSLVSRTLAEKWQLESWSMGLLGMSVYSGMFAGGLVCGPIADGKGRSFTLITATLLISVFGVLSAYAPTFSLLCAARFIAGIGMGASLPVSSSLLQETVPAAWKGGLACLVFSGFNLGELFAAKAGVLAFMRPDPSTWLFLVAAVPAILTFGVSLLVPESPRFLAARGDNAGVLRWFTRAAVINRKKPRAVLGDEPESTVAAMCGMKKPKQRNVVVEKQRPSLRRAVVDKFSGLFEPGGLRLRTLVLWTLWMAANASFYGLIFSLPEALRASKIAHLDSSFTVAEGITKVSAYQSLAFAFFLPLVALNVSYAKLFPLAFAGAFVSLAAALFSSGWGTIGPSPAVLVAGLAAAKFWYNGVFMMLYPLTGGSYPTVIKATGTAIAGTVGRICTILVAPVCTRLQLIAPLLPYQCFLVFTAMAFFASLLL